jgi:hypothetical protein
MSAEPGSPGNPTWFACSLVVKVRALRLQLIPEKQSTCRLTRIRAKRQVLDLL